jgi:Transposase DDE domain group 1
VERLGPALAAAQKRWCLCGGNPVREFREFAYQTARSWRRPRRVIGKAEVTAQRANPRFIVTNLPAEGFKDDDDKTRFTPRPPLRGTLLRAWRDGKCA